MLCTAFVKFNEPKEFVFVLSDEAYVSSVRFWTGEEESTTHLLKRFGTLATHIELHSAALEKNPLVQKF